MVFFGRKATPEASPADSARQQIQQQTAQELAVADVTELLNSMTRNCYEQCFPNPGPAVTASESTCTRQCVQKYMAAWNLLSQTYVQRLQQSS